MKTNTKRRDEILRLRKNGLSYGEICKQLKCDKGIVAFYCGKRYLEKEKQKKEYELLICNLIKKCENINQVCKILNKKPTNSNYKLIENIINKYNINTDHFCINFKNRHRNKPYTKEEIFTKNSVIKTSKLLPAILKFHLKEYKCECCGNTEWNKKPIPLQTHHINGENNDNRIENLMLLCPNCHAQTDNYCGRGKRKKMSEKHNIKICSLCGKEFKGNNKFCSIECFEKYKKQKYSKYKNNITKEKLINLFLEYKTFTKIGKYFNVSDKAISKWCESVGLPRTSKGMKQFISECNIPKI